MNTSPIPDDSHRGRLLDARLHLLDRQLVDENGDPVGIVDDLELDGVTLGVDIGPGAPPPTVSGILTGHVLLTRIFGGRPPVAQLQSIAWRAVTDVGAVVRIDRDDTAFDTPWVERWLRERLIGRIPGGRRATR
ncbi:hypothetical protein [Mycobacterium sp. NAZ190054]|uniref:hypothetical protein n=1 Tax=Mycobacterium sp. NAZ190054 TaxID=1747766 RepID=UPI00079462D0|nr:hypothetical protein [Mycobacterium sp. NAZ190054]KWX64268.1 hypothetical protein ASJ79_08250 [Mycobacterium sp. NAZ190054]